MRYRPTTEPKGKWAIAINAKRRADKLSRTAAFEVLGPKLGYSTKSLSAFRLLDIGERQPDENEQKVLAEWLGYWPTDEPTASEHPSDMAALIAALAAQTAAITALVDVMRSAQAEQSGAFEGIERALRVVANIQEAGASEPSNEPQSRAGFQLDRPGARTR
jgi:hypothetical protein